MRRPSLAVLFLFLSMACGAGSKPSEDTQGDGDGDQPQGDGDGDGDGDGPDGEGDGDGPVGDGDRPDDDVEGDGDAPGDGDGDAPGDGDGDAPGDGDQEPLPGDGDGGDGDEPDPSARVVGYFPAWRGVGDLAERVGSMGLTHINLAFANPEQDHQPTLAASDDEIARMVENAHAAGTKVLVSIGGGDGSGAVAESFTPGNVDAFVANLAAYLERHDLDGLDVDVEGAAAMTADYAGFVQKVSTAVHDQGKLLTAAFATWFVSGISDETLAAFDFINVMSYDHCGPWTGACEQATYDHALSDLGYFADQRGIEKSKVVLGVPFYAWCWGACNDVPAFTYAELISLVPSAPEMDWIDEGGRQLSYNGEATMRRKVELSRDYGGIMIWELGQDAQGERSLLRLITGN